jgi:hypothetical protein
LSEISERLNKRSTSRSGSNARGFEGHQSREIPGTPRATWHGGMGYQKVYAAWERLE